MLGLGDSFVADIQGWCRRLAGEVHILVAVDTAVVDKIDCLHLIQGCKAVGRTSVVSKVRSLVVRMALVADHTVAGVVLEAELMVEHTAVEVVSMVAPVVRYILQCRELGLVMVVRSNYKQLAAAGQKAVVHHILQHELEHMKPVIVPSD